MSPDVIIIGAGVAGLSAAVDLARRGARVVVLEAKAILGGRATAFTDPRTGDRVDSGQHVLFGCYHETFRFLRAIGTEDRVRLQATLDVEFVDQAGRRSRLRCPALPPPLNLIGGLMEWEALNWTDRVAALGMAGPIRTARRATRGADRRIAASPGETVEQWLVQNGQTRRLREMLWDPLAVAALNQSAREAAAPVFARVLAEMFSTDSRNAALGLPACPLDDLYAEPARSYLMARGGTICLSSPARVTLEKDAVSFVEARGERLIAGRVISAVPWFALPALFAGVTAPLAAVLDAASSTSALPLAAVNVWLDRRVMSGAFLGLPGRTVQWVFDKAQIFDEPTSHLTLVASGAAQIEALSNEDLTAVALGELCDAEPETRAARVLRTSVLREPRATFSLAPGQPSRPGCRTPLPDLFLAGDWIDTGLPATIESAAASGHRAAEAIS